MLAVAVCQFAPTDDVADNRLRIAEQVEHAAGRGARLVVFPEYSNYFVNPIDGSLATQAEALDGPFVRHLQRLAEQHGVTVVAGLIERTSEATHVHNTVVAIDASGIVAKYRKQHLYDAFGQRESEWIAAGETTSPETFTLGGFTLGLLTCYDLRFPEVARTLIDAGVDVLVVPAEWVRGPLKEHHWMTLLQARAIENTSYVVAADHPAPVGVGHSVVIDPAGVTIAGVGTDEGIAVAHLEPEAVARVRTVNPVLRVRRYSVVPRP